MRRKLILIVNVTLFFACFLVPAQESTKEAKIERILALTNAQAMMDQMFAHMKNMAASQLPPGTTPEERARVLETQEKIQELVKTRLNWDKLRPMYVKVYSETFADQEISGILAFYESPAGKSMLEKMPTLMAKTMAAMQQEMKDLMPEIQRITKEGAKK